MMKRETQLFSYSLFYYTPSGVKTYVNGVTRGTKWNEFKTLEQFAKIRAAVDLCANPKRKVAKGLDGITFTHFEPASEVEITC